MAAPACLFSYDAVAKQWQRVEGTNNSLYVVGGHPDVITRSVYIAAADGAKTDADIIGAIGTSTRVVVTAITVAVDSATTLSGGVAVKLGFGAANVPANSSTGANGVLLDHKGIAAGSGIAIGNGGGILGIGAAGEELRMTSESPTGGGFTVTFTYYTINA